MDNLSNFEKSNMRAYSDLGVFFNLGGKETLFRDVTEILGKPNPPEEMKTLIKVAKVVAFIALNIITVLMYVIYKAVEKSAGDSSYRINDNLKSVTPHLNCKTPQDILAFGKESPIENQRAFDFQAKNQLNDEINIMGGSCLDTLISVSEPVNYKEVTIDKLDEGIFSVVYALTVQDQMAADSKNTAIIALYGVASQFNGAESRDTTPVPIGQAEDRYSSDRTQGPGAQRMYPVEQVEMINEALYKGRNSIVNVLDDSTKHTLKGGYLIPATEKDAAAVIEQFKNNGHSLLSTCIGNKLRPAKDKELLGDRTEKVYMILSAAPAFGSYLSSEIKLIGNNAPITEDQKAELSFQVTLREYRSLFEHGLSLAADNKDLNKQVVIKPCALGLGAFENPPEAVAKAYYQAASEYAYKLKKANIKVELQIRPDSTLPLNKTPSLAEQMATTLLYPRAQSSAIGGGSK